MSLSKRVAIRLNSLVQISFAAHHMLIGCLLLRHARICSCHSLIFAACLNTLISFFYPTFVIFLGNTHRFYVSHQDSSRLCLYSSRVWQLLQGRSSLNGYFQVPLIRNQPTCLVDSRKRVITALDDNDTHHGY